MKTQNKFWWFVLVTVGVTMGVLLTILLLFWQQLPPEQQNTLISIIKDDFAYLFMAGVLLFTLFGFTLDWFFRFYIIPVNQLAEEIQLKSSVNPELPLDISGSHDVMRLAQIVAQLFGESGTVIPTDPSVGSRGKLSAESEKDILAALLEGLTQGIVVCNLDAKVVFYNRKAREIFTEDGTSQTARIGLGRSIYRLVEESLVKRALERISQKIEENQQSVSERFLIALPSQLAIPAEIVPVLDSQHHISGFILHIEDTSPRFEHEQDVYRQFQVWQQQLVQSVSVIKATAEILEETGTLDWEKEKEELIKVLSRESCLAADILTSKDVIRKWRPNQPWPLTPVNAEEWGHYIRHRAAESLSLELKMAPVRIDAKISIDMHHLSNALLFVMSRIQQILDDPTIDASFYQSGAWLYLDMTWHGEGIDVHKLKEWKKILPKVEGKALDICLGDILSYHGAKLWRLQPRRNGQKNGLRLLLPAMEHSDIISSNGHITILPDSRPEFYDFDLFHQVGQTDRLDDMRLQEVSYTVFDTETTGLDPHGGDEIISIGALRIVNGRLLKDDCFDQLVNPRRHLPWASVKYHGIRPEMLSDQPTIEQVLPNFFEFCRDTVMLGHNVAFDMLMLQLKEEMTGVRFINPILDTMLLSAVVHPAQNDHSLSAIAQRLGITVVGRHTAIGDATATAQIFLKLTPLLKDKGITTLLQARQASEKTYYARLKY